MKKARRSLLLLLVIVLAVVGAGGLCIWQAKRQYTRNRQFIDALVRHDNKAALALVNAGADPNTRQEASPPPTLPQLLCQLLRRSPPVVNDSTTAFHIACGGVPTEWTPEDITDYHSPDDATFVQAMLVHGGDVQATDEDGRTALFYAVRWKHPHIAQLLLASGANVNAPEPYGETPLMFAVAGCDVDTMHCLLEHGANVDMADGPGNTALYCAIADDADPRIIGMLLAHGADPNARNKDGESPLTLAQKEQRSDLVRLLRGKR